MRNVRYIYTPEVKELFLWNGKPVILESPSYGHITIWDIKGRFLEALSQYDDEIEEIIKVRIGKIIKPRWNKQFQSWISEKRGMTYEQVVLDGKS